MPWGPRAGRRRPRPPADSPLVRRYAALTFLRWLPTGLLVPVLVLLARARGLDLAQIGALAAIHSVVAAGLELPTGGLGDVVGRRPVLVVGGVLLAGSAGLVGVAHGFGAFAAVSVLRGAGRALTSGPLDAWFVDAADRPPAALTHGLARGQAAESVGLALGVVVGGGLAALSWGLPRSGSGALVGLSVPALVAAAVFVAWTVAVAVLVDHDPPAARASWRVLAGDARRTVAGAVAIARRDGDLRRLVLRTATFGVLLSTVELFFPLLVADRLGSARQAAGVLGVLGAAGFGATAVGAGLAPRLGRAVGHPARAAALTIVGSAAAVLGLGLPSAGAPMAAYLVLYGVAGATGPLVATLLHQRVGAAQRNTVLSLDSLALQAGALVATLTLPWLAEHHGLLPVWSATAIVTLLGVPLLLGLGRRPAA